MKTLFSTLFLAFALLFSNAFGAQAQTTTGNADAFFSKYGGRDGYTSVTLGPAALKLVLSAKGGDSAAKAVDGIKVLRIVTCENPSDEFILDARNIVASNPDYEFLSQIRDKDTFVDFYVKEGVSFLMITVEPAEAVVLEIGGKFNIKDVSSLSSLGISIGK